MQHHVRVIMALGDAQQLANQLMARGPVLPVMPTKSLPRAKAGVGIHDLAARTKVSRGWRAFARHDVLARIPRYSTQLFLGVA
jgi:hypothetical protein